MSKSSSGSRDDDDFALLEGSLLKSFVDGHSSAENGSSVGERESSGDRSEVSGVRDGPLLERSIDRESRVLGLGARGLESLSTLLAVEARVGEPLDTDGVSDLECGGLSSLERRTDEGDVSGSLVSSDERKFIVERPISEPGVKIGVANSTVDDSNENFSRLELRGLGNFPVLLDSDLSLGLVEDDGLLGLGDLVGGLRDDLGRHNDES
jgi:hypothetical protein